MTYCQLDNRWRNTVFGNSTSTNKIGPYGCYLCSLVSGLSDRGYDYDPNTFNDLLKSVNAWVGPFGDYIDSQNIDKYLPAIFTHFQKVDPWNDIPKVDNLVGENLIVVCRVNAKAIGGTGTHYCYLVGQQKGVALIYDPWRNVTELITKTYGNYGNVLGIDIFTVKVKSTVPPAPQTVQSAPTPPTEPPVAVPNPSNNGTTPPQSIQDGTTPVTSSSASTSVSPSETTTTSSSTTTPVSSDDTGTQNDTSLTPVSQLPTTPDVVPVSSFWTKLIAWLLKVIVG